MFALLMRALSPSPLSRPLHRNNCLSQFIYDLLLLKCFAIPPYMLFHQLEMPTLYRRNLYADPHFPGSLPAYGAHGPRTKPHVDLRRTAPLVEYTHEQNHFCDDGQIREARPMAVTECRSQSVLLGHSQLFQGSSQFPTE